MARLAITDADVLHIAEHLLQRHGRDAVLVAEMEARQRLDEGDVEGYRVWKRLVMMVDGHTAEDLDGLALH